MIWLCLSQEKRPTQPVAASANHKSDFLAMPCAVAAVLIVGSAAAQITVNTKTGTVTNGSEGSTVNTVDRRYQQITPTHVPLTKSELDAKTRLELIRVLESEQGFAMRPFPRGHKGLTLAANGKLEPAGEGYVAMVTSEGLSAKPGDRVVLSDIKIEHSRIVFELNGGPDRKHRFLRHVQIGMGPDVTAPVVQGDDPDPVGPEPCSRADRGRGEGAAGAAYLVRREDAHPSLYRHAPNQAQRGDSRPSCAGRDEHGHGAFCERAAGRQVAGDGRANAV
jgi:hypothetical protein